MKRISKRKSVLSRAKKSLFGFLFAIMCFVPTMYYILADTNPIIKLSTISDASKGDEVKLDLTLETDKEYSVIAFTLHYDADDLTFDYESTNSSLSTSYGFPIVENTEPGEAFISFVNISGSKSGNADLGDIVFDVNNSASGDYDITIENQSVIYRDPVTTDETPYEVSKVDGSIFVEVPLIERPTLVTNSYEIDLADKDNLTRNITITPNPTDTTVAKNYSFTSNKNEVATVDENGVITAVGIGQATITGSAYGYDNYVINVNVVNHITDITIDEYSGKSFDLNLTTSETKQLSATITPSASEVTDDTTIKWESSNPLVAEVSEDGTVKAVGVGKATIKATTSNGLVDTCEVNVVIPVTGAVFTENSSNEINIELGRNEKDTLDVTLTPSNTTDKISWVSNDPSKVIVDDDGTITGVSGGTTTVVGTIGDFTLTATVNVIIKAESISFNKNSINDMLPGQENNTLEVTIVPGDVGRKPTWDSTNKDVATVDENGVITAIKPGTTTITATLDGVSASCEVKVLIPITDFIVDKSEVTLYRNDSSNNTTKLNVTITEDAEEDKTVTWVSSNSKVATVDNNGNVTAVGVGETTITGTLKNGMEVTTKVYVKAKTESMSYQDEVTINIGESKKVEAILTPTDSTDGIVYSSGDNDIATVDADGTIHAHKKGTVVITATSGSVSEDCVVTVYVPVNSVNINQENVTINRGSDITLNPTINPTDASNQELTYESSNTKVATVSSTGVVTAIGKGSATITVKAADGQSDSFVVTVLVPITSFELDPQQVNLEIVKGSTNAIQLNTSISPSASEVTDDPTIEWKSSDPEIAIVDENGIVTGLKAGNVTITGTLKNGLSVTSNITVKIIPLDSISFESDKVEILRNETQKLNLIIDPINSTEVTNITWSSTDEKVVKVDENGNIRGIGAGEATIKAVMINDAGTYEAEIKISVKEIHLESIKVLNTNNKISVGQKLSLDIELNPIDTTDDIKYTYISSDESVAIVDENGVVTALKAGKVTITVIANDEFETSFDLEVLSEVSPQTGTNSIIGYIILGIVSLIGIMIIVVKRRQFSR